MSFQAIANHIGNLSERGVLKAYYRQKDPKPFKQYGRKGKSIDRQDRMIVRKSKEDAHATEKEIKDQLGLNNITVRIVQNRLSEVKKLCI